MTRRNWFFFFLALVMILTACGKTRHRTEVDIPKTGFLGKYYAKLAPGDEEKYESAMRWATPDFDLRKYDKLILDPILVYRGQEGGISREDAQNLADYMYNRVHTALEGEFELVRRPGPKTLRLTVALSSLEDREVILDTVSNMDMMVRTATEMYGFASDRPAFVGGAAFEAKTIDAHTGKVLIAEIDKRVGGKTLFKGMSDWADVINAIDYWAEQAKFRVCLLKKRTNCEKPPMFG